MASAKWSGGPNIFANGDAYLKGFLGLDWFPSEAARTNKKNYETWCFRVLGQLLVNPVGSIVLKEIFSKVPRTITLEPLSADDVKLPDDVPAEWINPLDMICKAKVDPINEQRGTKTGVTVSRQQELKGTGQGSDCVLKINPWNYHNMGGKCPNEPGRGGDEILLHELVHALSSLSGKLTLTSNSPNGFTNLEEFTAITVANVFSSQTNRALRADHGGFDRLSPKLSDSQSFYSKYSVYMQQICANHRGLAFQLAQLKSIHFNPFTLCTL
ncbi:hypothetical protein F183_A22250 [Bryobacterales bacterium F-183]|nr:hypothetical protein F183_A22250 [Bryobacterales bacterium F-183]